MFSDFSTVWVQFFLTNLVCFWSPTGEEQGSGRIFSCVGAHYGLPFPSGLQGRTCFLLWLLCLCEKWSTSHSPVPALPLTTRDKFPQPCVRVNTVTLVHIRWVDEYMDFISMKYFPKGEVAQLLNLWVMTPYGVSQLNVGIVNTLANGKMFLNMQWPTLNSKSDMKWILGALLVLTFVALCDFTVALVLDTQHKCYALCMPLCHVMPVSHAWNTSAQICDYNLQAELFLLHA